MSLRYDAKRAGHASVGLARMSSSRLSKGQGGGGAALEPGFASAQRGPLAIGPADGSQEPSAEMPHCLHPAIADDSQALQNRRELGRDRPLTRRTKLSAGPEATSTCRAGSASILGRMLESFADPFLAMVVVVLGEGIETAKKRPAHAPRDAMINTDLVGGHDLRACVGGHGKSLQRILKKPGGSVRQTTSGQAYPFRLTPVKDVLVKNIASSSQML